MVRRVAVSVISVISLFFLTSQQWLGAQEEQLVIEHRDAFDGLQRPPVSFNHLQHYEIYSDCVECHHIYEQKNGEKVNVWSGEGQTCSECHKPEKEGDKPDLMNAFHKNCTACHSRMTAEKQKSGPVTCGECHVRNE